MTNKSDIFRAYHKASWANPPASMVEAAAKYLAPGFRTLDKAGNVEMTREAYVGMGPLLGTAFKDFAYVIKDVREEGDSVIVTGHFEGTQTGPLDLSALGHGLIPASGKKIVWPESRDQYKFDGDKIVSITNLQDGNAMAAFLAPLGVQQEPAH